MQEAGSTFHRDAPAAARRAKLVPGHTGVEAGVGSTHVPYPQVAVVQNGDPAKATNV